MKIEVKTAAVDRIRTGALVLTVPEDRALGPAGTRLDRLMHGALARLLRRGDLSRKPGSIAVLYPEDGIAAERVILISLGKGDDLTAERMRLVAAKGAAAARSAGAKDLVLIPEGAALDAEPLGQAIAEGSILGLYRFQYYRSKKNDENGEIGRITVIAATDVQAGKVRRGIRTGEALAASVVMARDMVNTPGADMTPAHIAAAARKLGRMQDLRVRVLERDAMRKLGMGALLGVASGSSQPPKFIIVEYRGGGKTPWIALVGKTITFDSGGISIKPSENMDKMKDDMSGGAAVLGAIRSAAALRLPLNIVALLPAAENMPGGSAYKPGDVLRTMSGQTIEIMNTDAEGRLALADALAYACRYKPAVIVDIATLTGACRIALGQEAAGMLGSNEVLKRQVRAAGEKTGERVWELPLWEGYFDQIKSDIADMKNTGGRDGGVITAACLLSKFVQDVPWVHLDIAATAWTEKERPYTPKGATGCGCRLLTQFLLDYQKP
jgi:leucyl aminopeptidase